MGNFSGKDDSGELMRDGEQEGGHHHDYHHHGDPHRAGPIAQGRPGLQPLTTQQQQQAGGGGPGGGMMMGGGHRGGPAGMMQQQHGMGGDGMMHGGMMHVEGGAAHHHQQQHPGAMMRGGAGTGAGGVLSDEEEEDVVPTVFKWEHGGRQVYITGTFNNWERQIPMHRSGNDFTYIHNLPKGKHAFKFIVDDEWRYAPDQRTVADMDGRINNFIDVSDFKAFNEDSSTLDIARKDDEMWGSKFPDEEFTKEPPPLPPHLRHIILNKVANERDPAALPVPQHVALDHLYCTAIKDGMMVLGVTERYKSKFFTTVYYAMMP